jgi:acyl-ACP thioesterase
MAGFVENMYEAEFRVQSYEVDMYGLLRPVTLINYLQAAASGHASLLGVSVPELMKRNLTWVLSRLHLQVTRYPTAGALLRIRTWPSTRDGIFSCREFVVTDREGRTVALVTSSWAVLNLATRRPVRLEEHIPPYPLVSERAINDPFPTLPTFDAGEGELVFRVCRRDLDMNCHVNNAVYADWALESVPSAVADTFRPAALEIGFRAEALYGDEVICRYRTLPVESGHAMLHRLVTADGRELTRLRSEWRQECACSGSCGRMKYT